MSNFLSSVLHIHLFIIRANVFITLNGNGKRNILNTIDTFSNRRTRNITLHSSSGNLAVDSPIFMRILR